MDGRSHRKLRRGARPFRRLALLVVITIVGVLFGAPLAFAQTPPAFQSPFGNASAGGGEADAFAQLLALRERLEQAHDAEDHALTCGSSVDFHAANEEYGRLLEAYRAAIAQYVRGYSGVVYPPDNAPLSGDLARRHSDDVVTLRHAVGAAFKARRTTGRCPPPSAAAPQPEPTPSTPVQPQAPSPPVAPAPPPPPPKDDGAAQRTHAARESEARLRDVLQKAPQTACERDVARTRRAYEDARQRTANAIDAEAVASPEVSAAEAELRAAEGAFDKLGADPDPAASRAAGDRIERARDDLHDADLKVRKRISDREKFPPFLAPACPPPRAAPAPDDHASVMGASVLQGNVLNGIGVVAAPVAHSNRSGESENHSTEGGGPSPPGRPPGQAHMPAAPGP